MQVALNQVVTIHIGLLPSTKRVLSIFDKKCAVVELQAHTGYCNYCCCIYTRKLSFNLIKPNADLLHFDIEEF